MKPKIAKQYLEWWAGGAHISQGLMNKALDELMKGEPNEFIEECIRKRRIIDVRRAT